jgi:multimeric flavodoxin WrbA
MKVVAFNGSPRKNGNTAHAIGMVLKELELAGIETEIVHVGKETIAGCAACHGCVRNQDERCVLPGDKVNEWIQKMKAADGILLASPVHYSGIAGTMKSFLDRAFFVLGVNGNPLRHKVGAALAAVRRSGGLPTVNGLYHYLTYSEMMLPTSNYWNVAHGLQPGELEQDEEGVQIMQVLGRNMAWLMQVMELGKKQIPAPAPTAKIMTNFIR